MLNSGELTGMPKRDFSSLTILAVWYFFPVLAKVKKGEERVCASESDGKGCRDGRREEREESERKKRRRRGKRRNNEKFVILGKGVKNLSLR